MRAAKEPEKVSHVTRKKFLAPLFSGGLPPAGTFLGDDSGLERRMGGDSDLSMNGFSLGGKREKRGREIGSVNFKIGGHFAPFLLTGSSPPCFSYQRLYLP
jgi:hypothetical protein